MKKIGKLTISFLFGFLFQFAEAQQTRVDIEFNPEDGQVAVGEKFEAYITVQASEEFLAEMKEQIFPAEIRLEDSSTGGQSVSVRTEISNGGMKVVKNISQQYRLLFSALKAGTISFPSIQMIVDGKALATAPVKIQIAAQGSGRSQRQRNQPRGQNSNPFDLDDEQDPFSQLMRQRQKMLEEMQKQFGQGKFDQFDRRNDIPKKQIDANTKDSFFVHLEVDKTEVYEGEQVTANWYLYAKSSVVSLDRVKFPDLKGFWKEIIQEIPQLTFSPEYVNGELFQKALIASHALFPIKPGQSVIDEFKIKTKIRANTAFNNGLVEASRSSRRQVVKVNPIPVDGKPLSYSGAIGQFQVQTHLEGMTFPAGQPFSVRIRFEGQGNAKQIELPPIEWPKSFEIFDTKSDARFSVDGRSFKEFEILIVPKDEGRFQLPQINFSYFDPLTKNFQTKSTEPIDIEITKNLNAGSKNFNSGKNSAAVNGNEIKFSPEIILLWPAGLFAQMSWQDLRWPVYATVGGFWAFGFLAMLLINAFGISRRPRLKNKLNVHFAEIQKQTEKNNEKAVVTRALNVIYLLLAAMAQQKSASSEWHSLIEKVPMNLRDKFEKRLADLFDYFQALGFAPEQVRLSTIELKSVSKSVQELKQISFEIEAALPQEDSR